MTDTSSTRPETLTVSEFNAHMGYKGRYAYQLKKEGRLVMTEDGKLVRVAESIQRIDATRDPSRAAVAARHAAARDASPPPISIHVEGDETPEESAGNTGSASAGNYNFQDGKAKREHYAALREEAAYRKDVGLLMDVDEALGAFADAGARVSAVLDAVPATIGPMLPSLCPEDVLRVLTEQMDIARAEMAAAIEQLAAALEQRRKGGGHAA